jgi:quinol-cytochrome oxidoreductase complex cytochrome b subunit
MTMLPAASMATLVALVNTFLVGAIAATAYLALGGSATMALVYAGVAFAIASIVIWGWLFLELHRIRRRLVIQFPPNTDVLSSKRSN